MSNQFKIVFMGDGAVGKTAIRHSWMHNEYRASYKMTIGADFGVKKMVVDGTDIRIQMWDLAGQPRYQTIRTMYYKGATGGFLVYDLTKSSSFENLESWINELLKNNENKAVPLILVGNKTDLKDKTQTPLVNREEAEHYAQKLSERFGYEIPFVETSAKTGENVDKIFLTLARKMLDFKDELNYKVRKGVDLPSKTQEQIPPLQRYTVKIRDEDFSVLSDLSTYLKEEKLLIKEEEVKDILILEKTIRKKEKIINNKEQVFQLISRINELCSVYYMEKEKTKAYKYWFDSKSALLQTGNEEKLHSVTHSIIKKFWQMLGEPQEIDQWIAIFKQEEELAQLCQMLTGSLFMIALETYDAYKSKDYALFQSCQQNLKGLEDQLPQYEEVIKVAQSTLRTIKKRMPRVSIISTHVTPETFSYGAIARLRVKVRNNYTRNRTVGVKVTTTGFEFSNLQQSKRWREENIIELDFLLGRVWTDAQEQLSAYIEVKDGKFTEDQAFAEIPEIKKIEEEKTVANIYSIKASEKKIELDKEKTFALRVTIFNPSKKEQTVYLELDAPGFDPSYKRYSAFVIPATDSDMSNMITETVVLATPEETGDYTINLRLLDEEEKVINDSRRSIPCKCSISASKKVITFAKEVVSFASSVIP